MSQKTKDCVNKERQENVYSGYADSESTKTIYPKRRSINQIKRENIWSSCCVLTLSADVINLILIIVFIEIWFYFIAPLIIFVVLTVVLFTYKPIEGYKINKSFSSNNQYQFLPDNMYQNNPEKPLKRPTQSI